MANSLAVNQQKENEIAAAILDGLLHDAHAMECLVRMANVLKMNVLDKIKENEAALKMLAKLNTDDKRPFGTVFRGYVTAEQMFSTAGAIDELLQCLADTLLIKQEISSREQMLSLLKSIADMTYCYFLFFPKSENFEAIKNLIWLTPEETDGRLTRVEAGQGAQLALTRGIGTQLGIDLEPARFSNGMLSGKAIYAGVSREQRLQLIIKSYDEATIEPEKLAAAKRMQFYKIPLAKAERQSLAFYVNCYETSFEKLARKFNLPLVANLSNSTARTLITLQDLHAFEDDGIFNIELAHQLAKCLIAFYVYEGHHSFSEVAEIFNRLLDYVALNMPDKLSAKALPYYVAGDYDGFINRECNLDNDSKQNATSLRR